MEEKEQKEFDMKGLLISEAAPASQRCSTETVPKNCLHAVWGRPRAHQGVAADARATRAFRRVHDGCCSLSSGGGGRRRGGM